MCFSATASFGASGILTIVGILSVKKVYSPWQYIFAGLPLIFAIQQLIEGFVWLSLTNNQYNYWQDIPIYIFVVFAQVIWPVWVPLSFALIEKNNIRKKTLRILVGIGAVIALYHIYCLLMYPISAVFIPYHVKYILNFPLQHFLILGLFYLITIILPPFISSVKETSILGILLIFSFVISKFYYSDFVVSVWCFFAALVSILVYRIMNHLAEVRKHKIQLS